MYKIQLPDFEGPFDLLLYFIKRDEINIYDIPISRITEEFLHYIRVMHHFDLELAGEFIFMASNLMYIKTQMLLPRTDGGEGGEAEDPRAQLVQKILEYKQYKDISQELAQAMERNRYNYYRDIFEAEFSQAEGGNIYKNASLFDLVKAFQVALDRSKEEEIRHVVDVFSVSVEDKILLIKERLNQSPRLSFFGLVGGLSKQHIIVTFLAVLEMMKLQLIFLYQEDNFGDITIAQTPNLN